MTRETRDPFSVLIPVNATGDSKSRLSSVLEPPKRRELVLALLRDFLSHLKSVEWNIEYGVVTTCDEVERITRDMDGFVLPEPENAGTLGQIVDGAVRSSNAVSQDAGLLVMPVDLPLVNRESLTGLFDQITDHQVLLVPDEEEEGTNVLWRNPADVIDCQYEGTSSFNDHLAVAKEAGISPEIAHLEPFRFDLDTPEDWHRLLQFPDRLSEQTRSFVTDFMLNISAGLVDKP